MGKNNPSFSLKIMISELSITAWEWDLGIMIDSSLKTSAQ